MSTFVNQFYFLFFRISVQFIFELGFRGDSCLSEKALLHKNINSSNQPAVIIFPKLSVAGLLILVGHCLLKHLHLSLWSHHYIPRRFSRIKLIY